MLIDFTHFLLNYLLAVFLLRFIALKTAGTQFGNAVAYLT